MDIAIILFLFRLLSALLLLGFVGAIGWLIYRDMVLTAQTLSQANQVRGHLLVVASETGLPPVGASFPLLTITSIGRTQHNTIIVEDDYVSSNHASIVRRGMQWWLEDLGSRNGTLLNDLPLQETAVVSAGDLITIGNVQFKLELPSG